MIYSVDDVKRILDTLVARLVVRCEEADFGADELFAVEQEIKKLKGEL